MHFVDGAGRVTPAGHRFHFVPAPFVFCLHCGVSYSSRQRSDYGKLSVLSSEGRSTATTVLSLSALQALRQDSALTPAARKLLSFTDNRQDASLQAGHFNDFVKVSMLHPALAEASPAVRLAFMLEDAAVPVLLTQASLLGTLPVVETQLLCLDRDWPTVALNPTSNLHTPVEPHHLAYMIYTSGSTGRPKGVLIEHQALAMHMTGVCIEYGITASDRVLQFAALSFDAAQEQIFVAFCSGASLVVRSVSLWESEELNHRHCAVVAGVGSYIDRAVQRIWPNGNNDHSHSV